MLNFSISGRVLDAGSRTALPGWYVKAYDKDLLFDDVLGSATTDEEGRFTIHTELRDFREFLEKRPDLYFRVARRPGSEWVHSTEKGARLGVGEEHEILVPAGGFRPGDARLAAVGDGGETQESFGAGETLRIDAAGLRPATAYDVRVEADGDELFTARLLTDRRGELPGTVLWPQAFLDDPREEGALTSDEARGRWDGAEIGIRVVLDGEPVVATGVRFDPSPGRPVLFASDAAGRPRNGVDPESGPVHLTVAGVEAGGDGRVWVVPRQGDWRSGDPLAPVALADGEPAVFEVQLPGGPEATIRELTDARRLLPGAYDLVLRTVRYGFEEDEEPRLRAGDVASRFVTGLVVRQDFLASKFVLGGCVNKLPISGSPLPGNPYFQYRDTFTVGEDVWGALDPGAIDPGNISKMCAFYVVPSKTAAQWNVDDSLNHLPALGGNPAVQKLKVASSCINANDRLLWPNASQEGEYDIVADFGNNTPDATMFAPDDSYDTPLDVIDGYVTAGFRVVKDPGTMTDFAHAGTFNYDQTTNVPGFGVAGSVTVQDENTHYHTPGGFTPVNTNVDRRAHMYFPADSAGVTDPAQISAAAADYPLVMVVHGNGHSYTSYDPLLEHLARNGFIAASIHLNTGMRGLGRANVAFAHLPVLQAMFGAKLQNNIGLMGHSRGGEGVVKAARLNQTGALGHNINALMSLAPTDQYGSESLGGAWATPYFVLYGSRDGDIDGGIWTSGYTVPQTGFALWDRASGADKTMVFVHLATHNGFMTTNYDAEFGDAGSVAPPADQRKVTIAYANAFFRQHLKAEPQWNGMFAGDWRPASVAATGLDLYAQYATTGTQEVDDFESGAGWTSSSSGGTVSQSGLPAVPQEGKLHDHAMAAGLDDRSPHDRKGMLIRWDSLGDEVVFSVPAAGQDVSGFAALSVRIAQVEASASNPANQLQNLRIALQDGGGTERAVRAGHFRDIPYPDQRSNPATRKSAMTTIRIPLTAYTIKAAGAPQVDLTDVTSVKLRFTEKPTGEIDIDDVAFTD